MEGSTIEANETVEFVLGSPTNAGLANASQGPTRFVFNIGDNDTPTVLGNPMKRLVLQLFGIGISIQALYSWPTPILGRLKLPTIVRMRHFEWKNGDLHLRLKIVPRSSKNSVSGLLDDRLKINITAAPTDGDANEHLLRWLAKLCGVSKSSVTITAGETSRNKTVTIIAPNRVPDEFQVSVPTTAPTPVAKARNGK